MALLCRRKSFLAFAYHRSCCRLFSSAACRSAPPLPSPPWLLPVVAPVHTTSSLRPTIVIMTMRSSLDSSMALAPSFAARNCTSAAYPPPTPPGEFQGGEGEGEGEGDGGADGADVGVDAAADANAFPEEGNDPAEGMYDEGDYYDDDDGDHEEEEPPADPEAGLLYSPSDSD